MVNSRESKLLESPRLLAIRPSFAAMCRSFTPTAKAADIMEAFIRGGDDAIHWDDLESAPQDNPAVRLAIDIVHYLQVIYPPRNVTEYFHPCAEESALRVAALLRAGKLDNCPAIPDQGNFLQHLPKDLVKGLRLPRGDSGVE